MYIDRYIHHIKRTVLVYIYIYIYPMMPGPMPTTQSEELKNLGISQIPQTFPVIPHGFGRWWFCLVRNPLEQVNGLDL